MSETTRRATAAALAAATIAALAAPAAAVTVKYGETAELVSPYPTGKMGTDTYESVLNDYMQNYGGGATSVGKSGPKGEAAAEAGALSGGAALPEGFGGSLGKDADWNFLDPDQSLADGKPDGSRGKVVDGSWYDSDAWASSFDGKFVPVDGMTLSKDGTLNVGGMDWGKPSKGSIDFGGFVGGMPTTQAGLDALLAGATGGKGSAVLTQEQMEALGLLNDSTLRAQFEAASKQSEAERDAAIADYVDPVIELAEDMANGDDPFGGTAAQEGIDGIRGLAQDFLDFLTSDWLYDFLQNGFSLPGSASVDADSFFQGIADQLGRTLGEESERMRRELADVMADKVKVGDQKYVMKERCPVDRYDDDTLMYDGRGVLADGTRIDAEHVAARWNPAMRDADGAEVARLDELVAKGYAGLSAEEKAFVDSTGYYMPDVGDGGMTVGQAFEKYGSVDAMPADVKAALDANEAFQIRKIDCALGPLMSGETADLNNLSDAELIGNQWDDAERTFDYSCYEGISYKDENGETYTLDAMVTYVDGDGTKRRENVFKAVLNYYPDYSAMPKELREAAYGKIQEAERIRTTNGLRADPAFEGQDEKRLSYVCENCGFTYGYGKVCRCSSYAKLLNSDAIESAYRSRGIAATVIGSTPKGVMNGFDEDGTARGKLKADDGTEMTLADLVPVHGVGTNAHYMTSDGKHLFTRDEVESYKSKARGGDAVSKVVAAYTEKYEKDAAAPAVLSKDYDQQTLGVDGAAAAQMVGGKYGKIDPGVNDMFRDVQTYSEYMTKRAGYVGCLPVCDVAYLTVTDPTATAAETMAAYAETFHDRETKADVGKALKEFQEHPEDEQARVNLMLAYAGHDSVDMNDLAEVPDDFDAMAAAEAYVKQLEGAPGGAKPGMDADAALLNVCKKFAQTGALDEGSAALLSVLGTKDADEARKTLDGYAQHAQRSEDVKNGKTPITKDDYDAKKGEVADNLRGKLDWLLAGAESRPGEDRGRAAETREKAEKALEAFEASGDDPEAAGDAQFEKYAGDMKSLFGSNPDLFNDPSLRGSIGGDLDLWTPSDLMAAFAASSDAFDGMILTADQFGQGTKKISDTDAFRKNDSSKMSAEEKAMKLVQEWPADRSLWTSEMENQFDKIVDEYGDDESFDALIDAGAFASRDFDANMKALRKAGKTLGKGERAALPVTATITSDMQYRGSGEKESAKSWTIMGPITSEVTSTDGGTRIGSFRGANSEGTRWANAGPVGTYVSENSYTCYRMTWRRAWTTVTVSLKAQIPGFEPVVIAEKTVNVEREDLSGIESDKIETKSLPSTSITVVKGDMSVTATDFFDIERVVMDY